MRKRRKFDSSRMRVQGTEAASFVNRNKRGAGAQANADPPGVCPYYH